MIHKINSRSFTLLLSKYLFYIFIPASLMGMVPGGGGGGNDPYIQARNTFIVNYNNTNQNTNINLNNYNNRLLQALTAISNGAQTASFWADGQAVLAQIDLSRACIIYDRIVIIFGYIAQHATGAQGRAAAIQANVPGAVAQANDQNILNALGAANNIKEQAEADLHEAEDVANQAQVSRQDANASHAKIIQIINGMNQPILSINYTMNDVQDYYAQNNGIRGALADFNQANRSACTVRNSAVQVHNAVNNLDQFIQNIGIIGNNLGIALPPF